MFASPRRWMDSLALLALLIASASITQAQQIGAAFTGHLSGMTYNRQTGTYNSTLTLKNVGSATVSGNLAVVISTGNPAVSVSGTNDGTTYVAEIPAGGVAAGQSATVAVAFLNPGRVTFSPTVVSITTIAPAPPVVVTPAGGTFSVAAAGRPAGITQVMFPPGAVADPTDTISVGYSSTSPGPLPQDAVAAGVIPVSNTFTLNRTASTPFQLEVYVTVPYSTQALGSVEYPSVLYWDESLQQYHPIRVTTVDQARGQVTFVTKHFTSFVVVGLPGLVNMLLGTKPASLQVQSIDTQFRPAIDGFEIANFGTGQPAVASGGACYGLTSFAAWYFATRMHNQAMPGLFQEYQTASDPGSTHSPIEDAVARELVAETYVDTEHAYAQPVAAAALQTAENIINGMLATHEPQLVDVYSAAAAHSVLVYAWDSGALRFSVYDPNLPGTLAQPLQLVQGASPLAVSFNPWISGTNKYDDFAFDAFSTHYDASTVLGELYESSLNGPPGDAFGQGWRFNNLTITSAASGQPGAGSAYPGGPSGPVYSIDSQSGTTLGFSFACDACSKTGQYYLHVLQNTAGTWSYVKTPGVITPGSGPSNVHIPPLPQSSVELIAFVSGTDSQNISDQEDISTAYSAFQRAELRPGSIYSYQGNKLSLEGTPGVATLAGPITATITLDVPLPDGFTGYVSTYGLIVSGNVASASPRIISFTLNSANIGSMTVDCAVAAGCYGLPDAVGFLNGQVQNWFLAQSSPNRSIPGGCISGIVTTSGEDAFGTPTEDEAATEDCGDPPTIYVGGQVQGDPGVWQPAN